MDEKDLLDLKEEIEEAKNEVNQLKGQRNGLLESLAEDWKCDSVDEAEKKVAKLKKEIDKMDAKIQKGITKIEEQYDFE